VSPRSDRPARRVLIVGATSAIANETARVYAANGARLFLTGRSLERLSAVADDLRVRGARQVATGILDIRDLAAHPALIDAAFAAFGGVDVALIAPGTLPDQARCEASVDVTMEALAVNFTSAVALLTALANRFEAQREGCIAVIGSVAGDRGRGSNYVYGSAKGGLAVYLQGLRNRLHRSGIAVVTLKLGFIDTPMTAHVAKNLLFVDARRAGRAIYRAIEARRGVVYIPWFWRPILSVVRGLPEPLFKRLRL
jgi:decaprenylphospho-beta-D-erythro-pentofuranosid-2-ulose 2-reductase